MASEIRDIVYFLQADLPLGGRELRYSLRSLVNIPHRKVWMVTPELPDWVVNISWIPWQELEGGMYHNLAEKYKMLGQSKSTKMTDDVYVMDDDFYITKPVENIPLYTQVPLELIKDGRANNDGDWYGQALHRTYQRMMDLGWEGLLHPCLHAPYPITRSKFPLHLEDGNGPYCWKNLYTNHAIQEGWPTEHMEGDPKARSFQAVINALNGKSFLSSYEPEIYLVEGALKQLFPEPSRYEYESLD